MTLGKNLNYQLPKHETIKLNTLPKLGQEMQIDFSGKLNKQKPSGELIILIAVVTFSE